MRHPNKSAEPTLANMINELKLAISALQMKAQLKRGQKTEKQ